MPQSKTSRPNVVCRSRNSSPTRSPTPCSRKRRHERPPSKSWNVTMKNFDDSLHVAFFRNAQYFAADLFYESFATPFPVPRESAGLSIQTPPENWWQEVAFYKWSDAHLEAVGFCNWIRYADCYLCGRLCVLNDFYRRLPPEHSV